MNVTIRPPSPSGGPGSPALRPQHDPHFLFDPPVPAPDGATALAHPTPTAPFDPLVTARSLSPTPAPVPAPVPAPSPFPSFSSPSSALPLSDFESLHAAASLRQVVFRLHDPSSLSPLIWTGELDTSGFGCASGYLASLSPGAYVAAFVRPPEVYAEIVEDVDRDAEAEAEAGVDVDVDVGVDVDSSSGVSLRSRLPHDFTATRLLPSISAPRAGASSSRYPNTIAHPANPSQGGITLNVNPNSNSKPNPKLPPLPPRPKPHARPSSPSHHQSHASRLDTPYLRHTTVDHILGKAKQTAYHVPGSLDERPGTPEDDKSPWVSTSRSLMWVVWEVARRLALGGEGELERGEGGTGVGMRVGEEESVARRRCVEVAVITHREGGPDSSAMRHGERERRKGTAQRRSNDLERRDHEHERDQGAKGKGKDPFGRTSSQAHPDESRRTHTPLDLTPGITQANTHTQAQSQTQDRAALPAAHSHSHTHAHTPTTPPQAAGTPPKPRPSPPTNFTAQELHFTAQELHFTPHPALSSALREARGTGTMSMSVREGYETALALSRDSDEVWYYGRVFAESVQRNVVFGRERLPFVLPPQFFKPQPQPQPPPSQGDHSAPRRTENSPETVKLAKPARSQNPGAEPGAGWKESQSDQQSRSRYDRRGADGVIPPFNDHRHHRDRGDRGEQHDPRDPSNLSDPPRHRSTATGSDPNSFPREKEHRRDIPLPTLASALRSGLPNPSRPPHEAARHSGSQSLAVTRGGTLTPTLTPTPTPSPTPTPYTFPAPTPSASAGAMVCPAPALSLHARVAITFPQTDSHRTKARSLNLKPEIDPSGCGSGSVHPPSITSARRNLPRQSTDGSTPHPDPEYTFGWLDRLVWDPRVDGYHRAVQKVVERRRALCIEERVPRERWIRVKR